MPKGKPNKKHTGEFKQEVIETMYKEKLAEMIAKVKAQIKAEKEKMTGGPKKSPCQNLRRCRQRKTGSCQAYKL